MPISFRSAGTVGTTTTTSLTIPAPAGVVATDIVVAVIYGNIGTGAITPPGGWTLIVRTDDTTTQNMASYWALGSVAGNVFTVPTPANLCAGFMLAYSGVDNGTPMDVAGAGQINTSGTTWTAPSVTTLTANAWGVCFFGGVTLSTETFTDTAPLVHRQNGVQEDGADFPTTTAGATGTHTTGVNVGAVSIGQTVALRPDGYTPYDLAHTPQHQTMVAM